MLVGMSATSVDGTRGVAATDDASSTTELMSREVTASGDVEEMETSKVDVGKVSVSAGRRVVGPLSISGADVAILD